METIAMAVIMNQAKKLTIFLMKKIQNLKSN